MSALHAVLSDLLPDLLAVPASATGSRSGSGSLVVLALAQSVGQVLDNLSGVAAAQYRNVHYSSRSLKCWTLPSALRGRSFTNTTSRGTLKRARLSLT